MNIKNLDNYFLLAFATGAKEGEPLCLSKEAAAALAQILKLIRAIVSAYGSRVGQPLLWGGYIYVEIIEEGLVPFTNEIVQDLVTAIAQVEDNAVQQPPRLLAEAVDKHYCVDFLRAVSHARVHSDLAVSVVVDGDVFEIAPPSPAHFTEPSPADNDIRLLRLNVIGICRPTPDGNVVVLDNGNQMVLPTDQYRYDVHTLAELILWNTVTFVGPAKLVNKTTYFAQPGGTLKAQGHL